jgi:hypothetical protein
VRLLLLRRRPVPADAGSGRTIDAMTRTAPAADNRPTGPGQCWCCGCIDHPEHMVYLRSHPEVALCRGCARWAAKQAWEIDDRSRTGPLVVARDRFRNLRQAVVDRGWHRSRILGGPLRWLGERLP